MTAGMKETVFYLRQASATVHSYAKRYRLFQQVTIYALRWHSMPGSSCLAFKERCYIAFLFFLFEA